MPPIAKLKIMLSMSNPVLCANSNRLGGFQYFGTKIGSVNPKGAMKTLAHHMVTRCFGNSPYSRIQGSKNALDQSSHT